MPVAHIAGRFAKAGLTRPLDNDDILNEIAAQIPPPT